jgi:hypothetical protein
MRAAGGWHDGMRKVAGWLAEGGYVTAWGQAHQKECGWRKETGEESTVRI